MINLLASLKAGSTNGTDVTSSAIDTTGAGLIVVAIVDDDGTATLTDSAGNTWTHLTPRSGTYAVRLHYCLDPVTSASHTFSSAGTAPLLLVEAWAPSAGSFRFDDENGAFTLVGAANPRLTGSVTPGRLNAVVISAAGNDYFADSLMSEHSGGFTTSQNILFASGQHYGGGIAHKVVSSVDPVEAGWYGNFAVFPNVPLAIAVFSVPSPPVAYEDPCSITEPRLYMKVTTDDETFKMAIAPMRETAAQGGFGVPRLFELGAITKTASNPFTGALAGQSVTARNADTDRVIRAASAARTSLRGCNAEVYLTSKAQSAAGLPPRVLMAGVVHQNSADENLVHGFELNDPIGYGYSVTGTEQELIRRFIAVSHFPHCPQENVGLTEQFVIGRRAPLDHAKGQGVVLGITVGNIAFGGTPGTPTATTLADLVADLQASKDAGTLDADWAGWFGHADLESLAAYGGAVPSDLDRLADGLSFDSSLSPFVGLGYGDIDYYLNHASTSGGATKLAVLVSCAAISEVLTAVNGQPSLWIDDTQIDPAELGNSVWMPQVPGYEAHWAALTSDLFVDIVGTDGVTRRYTLALFDPASPYGLLIAGGARFHLDCVGAEDIGDGTGEPILEYHYGYRHVLKQFGLQTYYSGAWLPSPQFLFADGTTLLDRIDDESFDAAAALWRLTLPDGLQMSATFGAGTLRDFITNANVCGGGQFASDDYGRYFVKVLDRRPSRFFLTPSGDTHEPLIDRRHILPGFRVDPRPDWHVNMLTMRYGLNEYTGAYDRSDTGGVIPIQNNRSRRRHGDLPLVRDYPYLADDASAEAVGEAFVAMFCDLPYVAVFSRIGPCGLKDDLLQGVPVTHFNGFGANGFENFGLLLFERTFHPQFYCSYQALCVDHLLDAEDAPLPRVVADYPVNAAILVDPATGYVLVNGA